MPATPRPTSQARDTSPLSILMVASEAFPFAKTGGLADVTTSLCNALAVAGHDVALVMPRYLGVEVESPIVRRTAVRMGSRWFDVGFGVHVLDSGARVVFVGCDELYRRAGLYGDAAGDHADNALRFGLLARAAFDYASGMTRAPDILHAHDWQAGLVPVYARTRYLGHPRLDGLPTVFTIHNVGYQGIFPASVLPALDLPRSLFTIDGLEFWGQSSFLKAGINFCDAVTTVSRTHAREIRTREYGHGMDGVIRARADRLHGILNGIDTDTWDPTNDPHLSAAYSGADLSGKRDAKRSLLAQFELPVTRSRLDRPLVGMISRMVYQKGLDLIADVMTELPRLGATFVILGTGEARYQDMWRAAAARFPDVIRVRIGYDESLAHTIEAGADIFLMPSRYEPCGLNQMYSMRYGTVPVVRATGGLADVVRPKGEGKEPTGFTFSAYTGAAMLDALREAVAAFGDRERWTALQRAGMSRDFSWTASARAYVNLYRRLVAANT